MAVDCLSELMTVTEICNVICNAHPVHVLHTCNRTLLPANLAQRWPCWSNDGLVSRSPPMTLEVCHLVTDRLSYHSLSLFDSEQMIASQLTPHYWSISLGRRGRQSLPLMTSTGTRTERVLTLTVLTTWQNGWFIEQFSFCLFYCPFFLFSDLWITSRQRCWKLSSWLTLKVWRLSVKKTLPKSCWDSQTWKTLVPIWKMSASVYLMKRYSIHVRTVIYWTIHWSVMK